MSEVPNNNNVKNKLNFVITYINVCTNVFRSGNLIHGEILNCLVLLKKLLEVIVKREIATVLSI